MADFAHSIPVSDVHPLRGSTPPGFARPTFRPTTSPKPRPQTQPRLTANDAQIRVIATRLAPLIRREHAVQRRIETLDLHHLLPDEVRRLDRLAERMTRRIDRWTRRLIEHRPVDVRLNATAADAFVEMVLSGWTSAGDELGGRLALSVCHNAVELGIASTFLPHEDTELLAFIARHASATAAYNAAEVARTGPYQAYLDGQPPRPRELYWSANDRTRPEGRERASANSHYLVYEEADVERLRLKPATRIIEHRRPADWNPDETIVRSERVPDEPGEVRRLQIIAAWDSWEAEREALFQSSGLDAANDVIDAASEVINAIEDAILQFEPLSVQGLLAKARWIADRPHVEFYLAPLFRDLRSAALARVPQPIGDDQTLLHAAAEFRRVDTLQIQLCAAYDCDCDDIPGFPETVEPWERTLQRIASTRAESWSGVVTKAEVMKFSTVWDNLDHTERLGDSLAEDILRLAGKTWDPRTSRQERFSPAALAANVTRAA